MIVYDPLYGKLEFPKFVIDLLLTPEVRRLSEVRLLNTLSPSLATLSEIRRFSHTLGVTYLTTKLNLSVPYEEWKALVAASLVHDVATPPFAHLFEYQIEWDHEERSFDILSGTATKENVGHQIFKGSSLYFENALVDANISVDLVSYILSGKHRLSPFLFGSIDFDNLDNVSRMAWALKINFSPEVAITLASNFDVGTKAPISLPKGVFTEELKAWAKARRTCYETILFDLFSMGTQAALSQAIRIGIENDIICASYWDYSDDELLDTLRNDDRTKKLVMHFLYKKPPLPVFFIQLKGNLLDYGWTSIAEAQHDIILSSQQFFRKSAIRTKKKYTDLKLLSYVYVDKGTFEKKLVFDDPATGGTWDFGNTSNTVIFYLFRHSLEKQPVTRANAQNALNNIINSRSIKIEQILRSSLRPEVPSGNDQPTLPFSS